MDLFYNYLLILCNIWGESISAVDFLINFMDKRINYLDFVTKPIDSDGKLNNGFGWTEEKLDLYMKRSGRNHADFKSSVSCQNILKKIKKVIT